MTMDVSYNHLQDYPPDDFGVTLLGQDLWKKFHKHQTEMIITKTGRRMFPSLRVEISDMDPSAHYCVLLEFVPKGNCRFKYNATSGWVPTASEEVHSPNRIYVHPDSPANGKHWMSQPISFGRVKLTNTVVPPPGHVVLTSMHKYQPQILIVKAVDPRAISWFTTTTVVFPETEFIAVTAYQSEEITKLKIDHNPFAKGFRENGLSKCKRKGQERTKEESPRAKKKIEIKEESSESCNVPDNQVSSSSSSPCASTVSNSPSEERLAQTTVPYFPNFYSFYNAYQRLPLPLPSYHHQAPYFYPSSLNYMSPWSNVYGFQMLHSLPANVYTSFQSPQPKKLTDFSIRALTES